MQSEQKETSALTLWLEYARNHPVRARLRDALGGGATDTAKLAKALEISPPAVAYHRQVLEGAEKTPA